MRTINSAGLALLARAIAGEKIGVVQLLYIGFSGGVQRWALGGTDVVWGGHTWTGRDVLLGPISQSAGQNSGLRITLPGVTESERALAFADVEGAAVQVYLAFIDPVTPSPAADAMLVWAGELDVPGFEGGKTALVNFTAEHLASIALRQRPSRYTNDEQQRLHPGDTSLDVDPLTDGKPLVWPAASFFKQ